MVYIVTYDLCEPSQNYEKLLTLVKEEANWARLGGSSYLVVSNLTPVELRNKYKQALDVNDKLFVGAIHSPAAWTGLSEEVSNWIKQNL